jgi:hypothetical protein
MIETFTGGHPAFFDEAGREQLAVLMDHGLTPASRVVDVGCGALRGGRWLIPVLDRGHYCGVEPNAAMLARGLEGFVDPDIVAIKHPRFSINDQFDLSGFDMQFTHMIMRSVWTHASKGQIESSLDAFVEWGTQDAVLLTSVVPIRNGWNPRHWRPDYQGDEWVGISHVSDQPGIVAHRMRWIRGACRARRLQVHAVRRKPLNEQRWLRITRDPATVTGTVES